MRHLDAALRLFVLRPFASLLGAVALALGLVLAGLSVWVLGAAGAAEASIEAEVVLRARLDPKLDEAGTKRALLDLAARGGVREVAWVGPEAPRAELESILGGELLGGLDSAVFPQGGLARVRLERGVLSDRAALDQLLAKVQAIERVEGLEEVPYDPRHLAFLFDAMAVARFVGLGLALLALLSGALAIHQRVRHTLLERTQELALYRAFGATERWLLARFLVLALLIGAAAAALAIAFSLLVDGALADLASLLPGSGARGLFDPLFIAFSILAGLGIAGFAGASALARSQP
jgi:cell division protein FtsX